MVQRIQQHRMKVKKGKAGIGYACSAGPFLQTNKGFKKKTLQQAELGDRIERKRGRRMKADCPPK